MRAPAGIDRDLHFAFGTLLGRGIGRGGGFANARYQCVDGRNHEKVNRRGDQQKRNGRVDEVSDGKQRAVNSEADGGEVGLTHDRGDERREQVFGEGADHGSESRADDHADCHIHYVATKNELLEAAEHGNPPSLESAINVSGGAGLVKKCRTGPIGSSKLEPAKLQSDSLRAFLFDYDVYLTLWSFDREGENHLQFRRSPPSLSFPRNQHC